MGRAYEVPGGEREPGPRPREPPAPQWAGPAVRTAEHNRQTEPP
jgi:hypothetical protein